MFETHGQTREQPEYTMPHYVGAGIKNQLLSPNVVKKASQMI